jgi:Reverse transcriptase (RNA-dependent DNA polymerase)
VQLSAAATVIEPAMSEWASPIVMVPKPDRSLRFFVDYRKLNANTVPDTYPLPSMDECIDSIGEAVIFTTLDCNSGYWQIPIDPIDMDKTAFTSHHGLYRFTRLPFGLRNAPGFFQRTVDIILAGVKLKTCLVYLDDIIVFSSSREAHLHHMH